MAAPTIQLTDVGWKARRLVGGGVSALSVVAALSRSLYLDVGGELVWLGPPGATLHARAMIAHERPSAVAGAPIEASFDLDMAREWRPPEIGVRVRDEALAAEGRRLARIVERIGPPDGFGTLLVGRRPAFPLDRSAGDARAFLGACAGDDPGTASSIGERLLGLGPGLTPAGDDLIGGAFFGLTVRRALAGSPGWRQAAAMIRRRAPERTHRISAVLLGDLIDGDGYAPLHDLARALAHAEAADARDAAAGLIRIGHSSGWDILTGFLGALGALSDA